MAIDYPELEIRNEDRLAADMIARTSGGLTEAIVTRQIEERRELLALIAEDLAPPICPELTNANPSSAHTVILEAIAWALSQMAYRINRVPEQNLIAFANLFGIDRRMATAAVTELEFTVDPPAATNVTIPLGTEVSTEDGRFVFETTEAITIPYGTETGTAEARRTVAGHTLLSADTVTKLIDTPAYVESVTNQNAIDSGLDTEPVTQTLERVRQFQRRGLRLVTARDIEEAILNEGLLGNGVARAFQFIRNGQFITGAKHIGHTTVVVATRTGEPIDTATSNRIAALMAQVVGNQFVYIVDPEWVEFHVECDVKLVAGALEQAVVDAVEANLRNFYAVSREMFGRPILRSEIMAAIEGTAGVDHIVAGDASILASPTIDTRVHEFQLPKLLEVTINVV